MPFLPSPLSQSENQLSGGEYLEVSTSFLRLVLCYSEEELQECVVQAVPFLVHTGGWLIQSHKPGTELGLKHLAPWAVCLPPNLVCLSVSPGNLDGSQGSRAPGLNTMLTHSSCL